MLVKQVKNGWQKPWTWRLSADSALCTHGRNMWDMDKAFSGCGFIFIAWKPTWSKWQLFWHPPAWLSSCPRVSPASSVFRHIFFVAPCLVELLSVWLVAANCERQWCYLLVVVEKRGLLRWVVGTPLPRCILFTHHHESPESLRRNMLHHLEPSPTWGFPPSLEGGFGHQCLSTNHAARDFGRSARRLWRHKYKYISKE